MGLVSSASQDSVPPGSLPQGDRARCSLRHSQHSTGRAPHGTSAGLRIPGALGEPR